MEAIQGNSGTGRTLTALGLLLGACQKGLSVGFTTAAALVHALIEPGTTSVCYACRNSSQVSSS